MNARSFLLPACALLAGAGWLGWRHYSIAAVENENASLRKQLADLPTAVVAQPAPAPPAEPVIPSATPSPLLRPDGKPDWMKVAQAERETPGSDEYGALRISVVVQGALLKATSEELVAEAKRIAEEDLPNKLRSGLAQDVLSVLTAKDAGLAVKTFANYPAEDENLQTLTCEAFALWLHSDGAAAAAWLEAAIQGGAFPVKSISGANPVLTSLRGAVVGEQLLKDPTAAEKTIRTLPSAERAGLFDGRLISTVPEDKVKALVGLIERTVEEKEKSAVLGDVVRYRMAQPDLAGGDALLGAEGETLNDRRTIMSVVISGMAVNSPGLPEFQQKLDEGRKWAAARHAEDAGPVTGMVLSELAREDDFDDAAKLATFYQEKDGPDSQILETFLASDGAKANADAALKLLDKVADPSRRETLKKALEQAKAEGKEEEDEEDK